MNQPERVRRDDGLEALLREAEKILELQRAADEDVLERFALDQFHDDVGALRVDAVIENGDDVGVLEAGRGHGLAPGLLDESAIVLVDLHADALDRDGAVEMMVHARDRRRPGRRCR